MKTQRLLLTALLSVLCIQIVSLNPAIPFPHVEYAALKEKIQKQTFAIEERVQETFFSAEIKQQYGGLVFVGDVLLGRNVEVLMKKNGTQYPFAGLDLPSLIPNAAVVGNFEASMATPHVMTPALLMRFSIDEQFLPALKDAGYTHVSLANNHSLDYAQAGFDTTVSRLQKNSIESFGHGREVSAASITYIEGAQGMVALIGVNASERIPQKKEFEQVIVEADSNSVFQVVYVHWGEEYKSTHNRAQELLAKELVVAGADLIIGHHPHVVQDIDIIDGVIVFYSLGNYIFDQYFDGNVQEGLVVTLLFEESPQLHLVPVTSVGTLSQPTLMEPASHAAFLADLAKRSNPALTDQIHSGILPLTTGVATSTKMAMIVR